MGDCRGARERASLQFVSVCPGSRLPALLVAGGMALACLGAVAGEWWRYPPRDEIQLSDTEGDPLALIVDKKHRLPPDYVPQNLVVLEAGTSRTTREVRVVRERVDPLRQLAAAARRDGIDLAVLSGYRSFGRQRAVYASWVARQGGDQDATDRFSARPGHSEHQLGTAIDFTTKEIEDGIGPAFQRSRAAGWLKTHAPEFGFRLSYPKGREVETGYQHEGWHWRFWGEAAPDPEVDAERAD